MIINGTEAEYVDKDVLEILVNFYEGAAFRKINATFEGFKMLIDDNIEESFDEEIGDKFFPPVADGTDLSSSGESAEDTSPDDNKAESGTTISSG